MTGGSSLWSHALQKNSPKPLTDACSWVRQSRVRSSSQGSKSNGGSLPRQRSQRLQAFSAGSAGSLNFGAATTVPSNTVKVYEAGKQDSGKRIVAETVVQAPVDVVWRVLTNYDRLAEYVPNLEACERLPCPRGGKVWVRQRACSQGVLWRLEAEAVMEVEEVRLPLGRREARFSMLKGDFKEISGRWVMEPDPSSAVGMATLLRFDITVQPKILLPSSVVSYVVRAGLPANIQAVARKAEQIAASKLQVAGLARWAGTEDDPPIPTSPAPQASQPAWQQEVAEEEAARAAAKAIDQALGQQLCSKDDLPEKGPFRRLTGSNFPEAAPLTADKQRRRQGAGARAGQEEQPGALQPQQPADARSLYLGVVSVPLPPAGNRSSSQPETQQELDQRQQTLQAAYPAFGLRRNSGRPNGYGFSSIGDETAPAFLLGSGSRSALANTEVHLRRLDTFEVLHRRAVAAITINAPPEAVWEVLTDYNHLADYIPNLAISQRIALPPNAPPNVIRIRQVGYKRMLYMCLHAETVLDLIEKPESEIQFRQVAGDFERFQGKWMVQGLSPPGASRGGSSSDVEGSSCGAAQTQLKYAVEIVIPRAMRMLGVLEPLLERTVFEDIPTNMAAIKQRVEGLQVEREAAELERNGDAAAAATLRRKHERPPLAEMSQDFTVLAAELERCFGADSVLPSRNELRQMNRHDLEKAIRAHGGPNQVAQLLGWKLRAKRRRPKGYWDSLANVRSELDEFIEEHGLPAGIMPAKNDFVRAGRYDIARAVERWGGLFELASELGYAVGDSRKPGFSEWQEHISEVAASTGLSGRQGLFKLAAQTYAARQSMQTSTAVLAEPAPAEVRLSSLANGNDAEAAATQGDGSLSSNDSTDEQREEWLYAGPKPRRLSAREEIDAW